MEFVVLVLCLAIQTCSSMPEIRTGDAANKLTKIKPVGAAVAKNFIPLTELPPPRLPSVHFHDGRRHLDNDCGKPAPNREVVEGGNVEIFGDYYEEKFAKTVATIIFPDHIDRKHFEVTSPVPYLTVGPIEAIGYHPSTIKSEHLSECEKIYQDHIADQYSDETKDLSEESLEMARMPLFPPEGTQPPIDMEQEANMYEDMSI
ncbi:uncharacterized protein LOC126369125 [Pectinophora gossypiella]|uniref:uncharacterized protein LOC126369125 n=1 Tax=Pectinophora gossypiella TaxID=13191 RepID=UPI00214E1334|nr:uncharacterized protein LOC126369125 [Pectinophora gossypiella]